MRFAFRILIGLSLLQGTAFALQGPEIQVMDGKVTMSAQAVPLGQLLTLLDRAMGLKSEILKPDLANRNISVRFSQLDLNDAVRKIFEGQPLNYMVIEGRGIRVTELVQGGSATVSSSSSFPESQPVITNQPILTNAPPLQPANAAQPANAPVQPANANNPFGTAPIAGNPNAPNTTGGPGQITPGQLPPPMGTVNPLITPAGGGATSAPAPAGFPFPGAPTAPAQPSGPGAPGTVTPGTIGR